MVYQYLKLSEAAQNILNISNNLNIKTVFDTSCDTHIFNHANS
jgi:hypothetical protein